jgi:hypothetical protein
MLVRRELERSHTTEPGLALRELPWSADAKKRPREGQTFGSASNQSIGPATMQHVGASVGCGKRAKALTWVRRQVARAIPYRNERPDPADPLQYVEQIVAGCDGEGGNLDTLRFERDAIRDLLDRRDPAVSERLLINRFQVREPRMDSSVAESKPFPHRAAFRMSAQVRSVHNRTGTGRAPRDEPRHTIGRE